MKLIRLAAIALILGATACSGKSETDNVVVDTVAEGATEMTVASTDTIADEADASETSVVAVLTNDSKVEPGSLPLVIDFSAVWCGPCQQFKPVFHKVAQEYAAKANFATADVDECTTLAQKYEIQSIPYLLIILPDGKTADHMGKMTEAEFKAFLDANIK